jgi:serine protease
VIVRYRPGTSLAAEASAEVASGARGVRRLPGGAKRLRIGARASVREALARLRGNRHVAYAVANYVARASGFYPNDPGFALQWNLAGPYGINMPDAWTLASARNAPGGRGVVVAVLDTGVAYRARGRLRRAPDLHSFVRGYDCVDDDPYPLDHNGHGTHVAGTIGEKTDNSVGLTGLAYRAKLMPVRVLDKHGRGQATDIAKGIRFAVAHHAQVINMSFNFGCGKKVPEVDEALREAYAHGVVAVASAGNLGSETCVSEPATGPRVIGVGGTTEGGCLGSYSLAGKGIDLVAPGGGTPVAGCPSVSARPIYQVTLKAASTRIFAIPSNYVGTSMAAAHVTGVAAMVIASGVIGPQPTPQARATAIARQLRTTARSLGLPSTQQGAGLIDAARATEPEVTARPLR